MDETGVVLAVSGGKAEVAFQRSPACERCGACLPRGDTLVAELDSLEGLRPGDRVRVEVEPGAVLKAAAWLYLLPAAALLVGVALARALNAPASLQWTGGLCAVALSGILLRRVDRSLGGRPDYAPRIAEVLR